MGRSPRNRAQHTPQNAEAQPWAWLGSRLVDSGGQGSGVACFHFFQPTETNPAEANPVRGGAPWQTGCGGPGDRDRISGLQPPTCQCFPECLSSLNISRKPQGCLQCSLPINPQPG
jgi:hypothetical protein